MVRRCAGRASAAAGLLALAAYLAGSPASFVPSHHELSSRASKCRAADRAGGERRTQLFPRPRPCRLSKAVEPQQAEAGPHRSFIQFASSIVLGVILAISSISSPASAVETAYQLQLPDGFNIKQQQRAPKDDPAPRVLLVALDGSTGIQVQVVRVPLAITEADPQGLGAMATMDYFMTSDSQVPRDVLVDILQSKYKGRKFIGYKNLEQLDLYRNSRKYLQYDFQVGVCEGVQIDTTKGKECQMPGSGEVMKTFTRRHRLLNTVYPERDIPMIVPEGVDPKDMVIRDEDRPQVLWILDISAPVDTWPDLQTKVKQLVDTFAIGTPEELQAVRGPDSPA